MYQAPVQQSNVATPHTLPRTTPFHPILPLTTTPPLQPHPHTPGPPPPGASSLTWQDAEGDVASQLEAYCCEMESTAAWGGQLELGALSQVGGWLGQPGMASQNEGRCHRWVAGWGMEHHCQEW